MATKCDVLEIYETERSHIIAHVNRHHGASLEDAEDALQDVMCKLLENWKAEKSTLQHWQKEDLIAFFIVAVKSRCVDIYRHLQRGVPYDTRGI